MDERCPVTPGSSHGPAFHESASALLRRMDVDSQRGLSREEAARRLQAVGPNRLRESRQRPPWRIALDQFQSPVVLLLLVAAAVAAGFGEFLEAVAIGGALLINALIGFGTEWRARQSMEALQRVGQMTATVRRSGAVSEIPARELVPGDIVQLSEGEVVPADLRVIAAENLQCDEAALTGESVPVAKNPTPVEDPRAPLSARHSMVFKGTAVTRGTAQGVVVGTGMDTEIGRVAALVEEARGEFPALALGVGPAEAGTLSEPPRDPKEPILTRRHWWAIAGFGVLMSAALLGVFAYALRVMKADTATAVSMAFLTYGLARLWHAFNMRSPGTGVLRNEIIRNPYVWAAFALCGGLLLAGVYVPALAGLLKVVPLEMSQWWVVLGASLVPVILGQMALVVAAKVQGASGRARGS